MPGALIGLSMSYMQLGKYFQFHVRDTYIDAIYANGGLPFPIPCTDNKAALKKYLEPLGSVVLIGGQDYPPELYGQKPHPETQKMHERRVRGDLALLETALELNKPLLGICAGMQLINIHFGGALIQHIAEAEAHQGDKLHRVRILGGHWLPRIFGREQILVNSNHHQAVDPERLGTGLEIVAVAEDGMVEAIEYRAEQMVLGVQWHPERIRDQAASRPLFKFLSELAQK
ncbi:MAG: gamma-glutamyl-gamma-aminobutyrate hydrolase family protein [Candidatus Cloacimonetes bacterium]|nr:gamma-glutamyl-gamma-aminobutyrate hydrolase family protein [Candidatus Cloacimonadota bacterium]